jgi:hypothetical protein
MIFLLEASPSLRTTAKFKWQLRRVNPEPEPIGQKKVIWEQAGALCGLHRFALINHPLLQHYII